MWLFGVRDMQQLKFLASDISKFSTSILLEWIMISSNLEFPFRCFSKCFPSFVLMVFQRNLGWLLEDSYSQPNVFLWNRPSFCVLFTKGAQIEFQQFPISSFWRRWPLKYWFDLLYLAPCIDLYCTRLYMYIDSYPSLPNFSSLQALLLFSMAWSFQCQSCRCRCHEESNKLKIFPNGILYLQRLNTLDLSNNDLTHIPPELGVRLLDLGPKLCWLVWGENTDMVYREKYMNNYRNMPQQTHVFLLNTTFYKKVTGKKCLPVKGMNTTRDLESFWTKSSLVKDFRHLLTSTLGNIDESPIPQPSGPSTP